MARVYLNVDDQRERLRLIRDREGLVGGLEDDDQEIEVAPVRRNVPAPRQANALGLPFELTWERVLLAFLVVWFLWKFIKRSGKTAKSVAKLRKQVKALTASREVIDV